METMVVQMNISKDLFSILGQSRSIAEEAIQEFSTLCLYLERRISAGKAAELMGIGQREFVRLLARKGIPYFDYAEDALEQEWRALDECKPQRNP